MGLLSFEALNGNNIPSRSAPRGLLGLGGFGGSRPPAGLLGPYYDPAEERRRKISGAMTQAGIQLLTNGKGSFGEVLGQGLAGAVEGANNAGINYREDALGYQQLAQQQKEQAEKERTKAAIMQWVDGQPEELQEFYRAFPEQGAKHWLDSQGKSKDLMSVGKGSSIYDPNTKTWIAPPAGAGGASQAIDDPLKISKNFEGSPGMSRIAQIAPTIKSMEKSLSDPSAMADLDFVYGLAKILDPTSVVRESEGKMVIDAQGIGPQMLGQLNKFMSGEQAMLPEIRQKLFGVAVRRAKELEQQAITEREHFSGVATENQFNPETYLQQVPRISPWADQNMQPPVNQVPPTGTGKTNNGVPWKVLQ